MRPIDADAIADYLDNELLNECLSGEEHSAEDAVRCAMRKVLDAPTLDVEPVVHAHWEKVTEELFQCSRCKYPNDIHGVLFHYRCPSCAAMMDAIVG